MVYRMIAWWHIWRMARAMKRTIETLNRYGMAVDRAERAMVRLTAAVRQERD